MKRSTKIALILILIVALGFLGLWFFAREQATKKGTAKPSFKDFFTFNTTKDISQNNVGELSGSFTENGGSGTQIGTTDGSTTIGGNETGGDTSIEGSTIGGGFTNGTITPIGGIVGGGGSIGGGNLGGTTVGGTSVGGGSSVGGTSIGGTTVGGTSVGGGSSVGGTSIGGGSSGSGTTIGSGTSIGPQCSVADSNIRFTQEELSRLQVLQQRFNTIASYLHTDGDIAIVEANYDSYKVKDAQVAELAAYCENTLPRLPSSDLNHRVPTPFWHNPNLDNMIFGVFFPEGVGIPYNFIKPSDYAKEHTDDNDHRGVLEHALGINIW